jgi:hypothetical protein
MAPSSPTSHSLMAKMETTSPPIFSKKLLVANYVWRYVFTNKHGVSSFATSKKSHFCQGREGNTLFFGWLKCSQKVRLKHIIDSGNQVLFEIFNSHNSTKF